jgi:antagonist of KipI
MTTVQDLGRPGYQRFGMVVAGAMDAFALQAANMLAGNPPQEAAIELALGGASMRALRDCVLGIAGADLSADLDGRPIGPWQSVAIRAGQVLSFGAPRVGVWTYVAPAGGLAVPRVMGSKSTYLRAKVGGLAGRRLQGGDVLSTETPGSGRAGRSLAIQLIPAYADHAKARVVPGPQETAFTPAAMETFLSTPYEVTRQADRMGYRLRGQALALAASADILSDALVAGAVQVTPDGQPTVLMADRQTIGGYAKIATVISADLPRVAQLRPGQKVSFRAVSVEEAQDLAAEQERVLARIQSACEGSSPLSLREREG